MTPSNSRERREPREHFGTPTHGASDFLRTYMVCMEGPEKVHDVHDVHQLLQFLQDFKGVTA